MGIIEKHFEVDDILWLGREFGRQEFNQARVVTFRNLFEWRDGITDSSRLESSLVLESSAATIPQIGTSWVSLLKAKVSVRSR